MSNHAPIVSHIHSLFISQIVHQPLDLDQLFGLLTLPSIRNLSLNLRLSHGWPQMPFMSFISRSSCRLAKLVLRQVSMTSEDLTCILEAMPSLCELEIGVELQYYMPKDTPCVTPVDDAVLQNLTYDSDSSGQLPLAPSLHTIHFWGRHAFEDHSLLSMIESRFCGTLPEGLERLQSVVVSIHSNFAQETLACVGRWKEQGLDISLKTRH